MNFSTRCRLHTGSKYFHSCACAWAQVLNEVSLAFVLSYVSENKALHAQIRIFSLPFRSGIPSSLHPHCLIILRVWHSCRQTLLVYTFDVSIFVCLVQFDLNGSGRYLNWSKQIEKITYRSADQRCNLWKRFRRHTPFVYTYDTSNVLLKQADMHFILNYK